MKRRTFIQSTTLLASPLNILSDSALKENNKDTIKFSGFIFSDAHIGWRGADQPTVAEQANNIDHIVKKFPNLNVAFDTGDIHHGYLNENERVVARSQWINHIANKFNKIPLYYIPGNHELGKGFNDPEVVAGIVGNHELRPYYSFDIKGIHFVSLPQLLDTIYVTEETLNWLALDLQLNVNKTTIILSHNSIKNTTFDNGETGYRAVTNSKDLMNIIKSHGNVVAWFHGHNHHYQIVKKHEMLFVSNGRIGGFNPPTNWGEFGQGHLGGIYFEIDETELVVKCYSSSNQDFLENLGFPGLSFRHKIKSTLKHKADANHYYGHGKISDGVNLKIQSHYLTNLDEKLYYKIESTPINENSDFQLETNYFFAGRAFDKVVGYSVTPKNTVFDNVESGLLLNPKTTTPVMLIAPVTKNNKLHGHVRGSYYRFSNEINYRVQLSLDTMNNPDSSIVIIFEVFDERYNVLLTNEHRTPTLTNKQEVEHVFKPVLNIVRNPKLRLYFRIKFVFEKSHSEFIINHLLIKPISIDSKNDSSFIEINSDHCTKHQLSDDNNTKNVITLKKQPDQNIEFKAKLKTDQLLSFLIKKANIQWQVRNATAKILENQLSITKNNNPFTVTNTIILVPFQKMHFYIYQLENIENAKITYNTLGVQIRFVKSKDTQPLIYLYAEQSPKNISGVKVIYQATNEYKLIPQGTSGEVKLEYQA